MSRSRGGRSLVALVGVLAVVLVAACSSGAAAKSASTPVTHAPKSDPLHCPGTGDVLGTPTVQPDTTADVDRLDVTLVDRTRSTASIPGRAGFPCRVLPLEVRWPAGQSTAVPLIVVAHGLDGNPTVLAPLLDTWARAGYGVAAPTFPTTEKDQDNSSLPSENVDQAADLSFVIDHLARETPAIPGIPAGIVDPHHIGAAGMSLGGQTIYGLVTNSCCKDERIDAAILMAAVFRDFPTGKFIDNDMPVLLIHGDADRGYDNSRRAYPQLEAPKWFITLKGAGHSSPFEVPLGSAAPLVQETTTLFWNHYLKEDAAAGDEIVSAVRRSDGTATLQRDVG